MEAADLLSELESRLPELAWKVTSLQPVLFVQHLPKGLFRAKELTGGSCLDEIRADIRRLSHHQDEPSALYIAERIKQKIHTLVGLCQLEKRTVSSSSTTLALGLDKLTTRQQWVQQLEAEVHTLSMQQAALRKTLSQMQRNNPQSTAVLNVIAELGELEKKLTLAQERFARL